MDLSDAITQEAIRALGIHPDELVEKPKDYFIKEGLSEELVHLRYNHHLAQVENSITMIAEYVNSNSQKKNEATEISVELPKRHNELKLMRKRHRIVLERALAGIQSEKTRDSSIVRQRRASPGQEKLKELSSLQKENYQKIQRRRRKAEKKALKYTERPLSVNKNVLNSTAFYSRSLSKTEDYSEEVKKKLQFISDKIDRSSRNHQQKLQEISEIASKKKERIKKIQENREQQMRNENSERLEKMLEKNFCLQQKKKETETHRQLEAMNCKQKNKDKHLRAVSNLRFLEKEYRNKSRAIERRNQIVSLLIQEKQELKTRENKFRAEITKLKEEDALLNHKRNERIMVSSNQEL